ncbi:pentapeptide repeat protein [Calothrix sp. NIES-4071]|nr:pentapeptide repeat protein [Calothrix sp. NIES-4071]BAZ54750.1 pentapeptide repeat protein [Calothrix sp. NIES-4105]
MDACELLKRYVDGERNFIRVDLSNIDLSNAKLRGVNLSGVN